jgi:hypothetical protein
METPKKKLTLEDAAILIDGGCPEGFALVDFFQGCRESDRIAEGLDTMGRPTGEIEPLHCMTCDKAATTFCINHHDIGKDEKIPFHLLPPIQAFTRRLRNEPLTLTFDVEHPGDVIQSLRRGTVTRRQEGGYSDRVTVTVDSGDPGGDPGEPYGTSEFESYIYKAISEWFDGAAVGLRPANLPKNAYPVACHGQIEYMTVPED